VRQWVVERPIAVFEKSFEGSPRVWKGKPVMVEVDGEYVVVEDWSPQGSNTTLQTIRTSGTLHCRRGHHERRSSPARS
jgi:hypothetical protein